ncbi:MAG: carboxypeptidase regulatory-like domain-containing protein [Candidatus Eremiobacteraeota bacterium]|nr:carboxypeptidase regulatory-like domain-containing protein [Candidatus Eremiobacteraeota bacterium]MBV9264095.1 carboxypeptidase regulatory-like domain-containing protein [Candidatus Eremiobacteraeota bacterium]
MKHVQTLAAALLLALIAAPLAVHAGTLGGISGVVTDAKTGAPVAGAHLTITSGAQAATATTDSRGHYTVFTLQPDDYTITAEKHGYESTALGGCSVFADQTQIYDLKLSPASTENR